MLLSFEVGTTFLCVENCSAMATYKATKISESSVTRQSKLAEALEQVDIIGSLTLACQRLSGEGRERPLGCKWPDLLHRDSVIVRTCCSTIIIRSF